MRAFNPWRPLPATTLLLVLASLFPFPLSAQTQTPRKLIQRQRTIGTVSSGREKVDDPPVLASSRISLPQRSDHPWVNEPQIKSSASSESNRSPVNLNLLLPLASAKLPAWTTNTNKDANTPEDASRADVKRNDMSRDRDDANAVSNHDLIVATAFAPPVQSNDRETAKYFTDPQYLAHRIPGVGSIFDRVLKESKAHPKLTRVLESIQPQF
jgi:hypothetical protein